MLTFMLILDERSGAIVNHCDMKPPVAIKGIHLACIAQFSAHADTFLGLLVAAFVLCAMKTEPGCWLVCLSVLGVEPLVREKILIQS